MLKVTVNSLGNHVVSRGGISSCNMIIGMGTERQLRYRRMGKTTKQTALKEDNLYWVGNFCDANTPKN